LASRTRIFTIGLAKSKAAIWLRSRIDLPSPFVSSAIPIASQGPTFLSAIRSVLFFNMSTIELILEILLALVVLICFFGGANLMLKGVAGFMSSTTPGTRVLDNLFRFMAGIYFGLGFLMSWIVVHLAELHNMIYFVGIVVVFSGLGRLYSRTKVGSAGKYFDSMMIIEILLGVIIILLESFRDG
jgi:hypothetical protein